MAGPDDLKPGARLGRYECLVPVASGGMGSVWAARALGARGFQTLVAVKTMLGHLSGSSAHESMFLDEARIASRIQHPNVVRILDLGEEGDLLYLVMEWVDGEPLSVVHRAASAAGGVPYPIAVRIVHDALLGLHAAHELKDADGTSLELVHRDVTPQNILVGFDGQVRLADFGVMKAVGRSVTTTSSGALKGKPAYMSSEQLLGERIDRRSDLFSISLVLYELTTGKHPFRAESDMSTIAGIMSRDPEPPSAGTPGYPAALEAVVMKGLARNPTERFASAAEMARALEAAIPESERATTETVATLMRALLGAQGEARRTTLREAAALSDPRPAATEPSWHTRDVTVDVPPKETPAQEAAREAVALPPSPRKRWPVAVALGLAAVVLVVVAGVATARLRTRAAVASATATATGLVSPPEPAVSVEPLAAPTPSSNIAPEPPPKPGPSAPVGRTDKRPPRAPVSASPPLPRPSSPYAVPPLSKPGF